MFMMLYGALGRCSLLRIVTLTPVMIRGENLTRPAPKVGTTCDYHSILPALSRYAGVLGQ